MNKPGWAPVKLPQTGKYASYGHSIRSNNYYGPTFGDGYDIYISKYASSNSFARTFLAGTYEFTPDEVEVFYETTKMQ